MNQHLTIAQSSASPEISDRADSPSAPHHKDLADAPLRHRDYITLWIVPLPKSGTANLFRPVFLSPEELKQIDHCQTEVAKRTALYSAAYTRIILAMHTGVDPQAIELKRGPNHKPFLLSPALPLQYNVSHSKDQFVMAISRHNAVGVDVEYRDGTVNIDELSTYLKINPGKNSSDPFSMRRFYDYWVTHEALQKCAGAAAPEHFLPLEYLHPDRQQLVAFGMTQYYQRLEIIDGYSLCLAMAEHNQQIYIKRIPADTMKAHGVQMFAS